MVNQKLLRYFQIYTKKGYRHNHLKAHLVSAGYNPSEIDEVINFLIGGEGEGVQPDTNLEGLKSRQKPIEINVLASFYFLFAFMLIAYGAILLINPDALPESQIVRSLVGNPVSYFAIFLFIVSFISIFVGTGILKLQPWAKKEGIALSIFASLTIVGVLITAVTLYLFSKKEVRQLFDANPGASVQPKESGNRG